MEDSQLKRRNRHLEICEKLVEFENSSEPLSAVSSKRNQVFQAATLTDRDIYQVLRRLDYQDEFELQSPQRDG